LTNGRDVNPMQYRPFGVRIAIGLSVLASFTCIAAESGLEMAAVQLVGRAEYGAGEWRVTWPGEGWRTAFSGSRVGVTTRDLVGLR
jgi:hypothetical protein